MENGQNLTERVSSKTPYSSGFKSDRGGDCKEASVIIKTNNFENICMD